MNIIQDVLDQKEIIKFNNLCFKFCKKSKSFNPALNLDDLFVVFEKLNSISSIYQDAFIEELVSNNMIRSDRKFKIYKDKSLSIRAENDLLYAFIYYKTDIIRIFSHILSKIG